MSIKVVLLFSFPHGVPLFPSHAYPRNEFNEKSEMKVSFHFMQSKTLFNQLCWHMLCNVLVKLSGFWWTLEWIRILEWTGYFILIRNMCNNSFEILDWKLKEKSIFPKKKNVIKIQIEGKLIYKSGATKI